MPINEQYSHKSFGTTRFLDRDPAEFNGTTIVGSCWSFEEPLQDVFPEGTEDVRFEGCRLDNLVLPPGSVLDDDCSNYQFAVMDDGKDWAGAVYVYDRDGSYSWAPEAVMGSEEATPYKLGAVVDVTGEEETL